MNPIARLPGLALIVCTAVQAGHAGAHELPLGDGNVSTSPRAGYVFSCQTRFPASGAGAQVAGAWIDAGSRTWDPGLKPIVDGSVAWPGEITITIEGDARVIRGNNLPDHPTGTFPIARSDDAYQYDRNPNTISARDIVLRLDASPQRAASPTCVPGGMIGFTLTGAALFNALDALGRDAAAHEIQDACDGHPQQQGQYHYHGWSDCSSDSRSGPGGHSDLVGYALDGFGIFGPHEATGKELRSADLDACHGHTGPVLWDGKVVTMYHYHFTEDYPYTVGCFMGEVTTALTQTGTRGNGPMAGGRRPPPPMDGLRPPPRF